MYLYMYVCIVYMYVCIYMECVCDRDSRSLSLNHKKDHVAMKQWGESFKVCMCVCMCMCVYMRQR
jgi:hypothetical protein